jgi:hypothetical protein
VLQWIARHSFLEPEKSELSEEQASAAVGSGTGAGGQPRHPQLPITYYTKDYLACALVFLYLLHKTYLWFWLPRERERDTNPKKKPLAF